MPITAGSNLRQSVDDVYHQPLPIGLLSTATALWYDTVTGTRRNRNAGSCVHQQPSFGVLTIVTVVWRYRPTAEAIIYTVSTECRAARLVSGTRRSDHITPMAASSAAHTVQNGDAGAQLSA